MATNTHSQYSHAHNIEPFDGNNYSSWKYRIKLIFMEKEVLDVVEKGCDETKYDTEEKKKEFAKSDIKARSLIGIN